MEKLESISIAYADFESGRFYGHLDHLENNHLSGWVYCHGAENAEIQLDVYAGGLLVGQATTNAVRPDLEAFLPAGKRVGFTANIAMSAHALWREVTAGSDIQAAAAAIREQLTVRIRGTSLRLPSDHFVVGKRDFQEWLCRDLVEDEFYGKHLPIEQRGVVSSARHYVETGWTSGLAPCPFFSPTYYQNLVGLEAVENPLVHYVLEGASRDLPPHPLFDIHFYRDQVGGDLPGYLTPLHHFIQVGDGL
ncbi:MAG: hypothetical protein EBS90_13740, partial [Betaproteobacteria bacterium]|nr:hypothetical protein [Betaproteobacteria bacterium]